MEAKSLYDCIECGRANCVTVVKNTGFCNTDGCVLNSPIQFVYYPNWKKPKTSRAGRELWWDQLDFEIPLPQSKSLEQDKPFIRHK